MGWICHECNTYNEDDNNRECWVCGALRSKTKIRKDKINRIKETIGNIFGSFSHFIVIFSYSILAISGFVMALFLVLSIVHNEIVANFLGLFNVLKDKSTLFSSTITQMFTDLTSTFKNIGAYFSILFHANSALNAIGPYFREFGSRFGTHFHAFIDFFKGLRWDKFSSIIEYIKSVIERIKGHFSSSKELMNAVIVLRKLIIIGG